MMLVVVVGVLLLPHAWAGSDGHLDLVIAVDLTKSVDVVTCPRILIHS